MDGRIQLLLMMLEQAYGKRTWHGANLKYSLRGLTVAQALWRPVAGRHNVWEYTLHCAYWKFVAKSRLEGVEAKFSRPFDDFPQVNSGSAAEWKKDLAFLSKCHKELLAAVSGLEEKRLEQPVGSWTAQELVFGVANHDIYHAGQIQLLRRLQEET